MNKDNNSDSHLEVWLPSKTEEKKMVVVGICMVGAGGGFHSPSGLMIYGSYPSMIWATCKSETLNQS